MKLQMQVNGQEVTVEAPPMKRLLDVLREEAHLTGTKEGCGEGECGACSVMINGGIANACLIPAVQAQGAEILTIEGLADTDKPDTDGMHPLQTAFIKHVGTQCGICTPGMLLSAAALLEHNPTPTREEIRESVAGNLCRCTGYQKIVDAIEEAAAQLQGAPHA